VLGALFAQDPADGVDDVGFATAVGANNADHVVVEVDPVRSTKDLKPVMLHFFMCIRETFPQPIEIGL